VHAKNSQIHKFSQAYHGWPRSGCVRAEAEAEPAAALALGADGAWLGSRFIVTPEVSLSAVSPGAAAAAWLC
jgi:hypothetical protein